jgi:hypothetical protein
MNINELEYYNSESPDSVILELLKTGTNAYHLRTLMFLCSNRLVYSFKTEKNVSVSTLRKMKHVQDFQRIRK